MTPFSLQLSRLLVLNHPFLGIVPQAAPLFSTASSFFLWDFFATLGFKYHIEVNDNQLHSLQPNSSTESKLLHSFIKYPTAASNSLF